MIGLRCLVLNSNYMPISLIPIHTICVEDAVTRVFNGTCHPVFSYDRKIQSPSINMNWPSVIARNQQIKIKEVVKLRRDSLFYRDHGVCAYCEKPLTINEVTYDHVIPRRLGGLSHWENIVSSCTHCNGLKGDKAPVGRWLPRLKPFKPTYYQLLSNRKKFPITVDHENWLEFLGPWEGTVTIRA